MPAHPKKARKKAAVKRAAKGASPRTTPKPKPRSSKSGPGKADSKPASEPKAAGRFSRMAPGSTTKQPSAHGGAALPADRGRSVSGRFSVHPSVKMMVQWVAELKPQTGRSLDEWVDLVKQACPGGLRERVEFLKARHGMGTNSAWWIAERAEGRGAEDLDPGLYLEAAERYVDEQLSGKKGALRPLFDLLLAECLALGEGVKACPCKTIVPIYRNHVVAQIKVASNSRVDLGLALGDTRAEGRLIDTGGFAKKDRITHRVEIKSPEDIDAQVRGWLKEAFLRDAK